MSKTLNHFNCTIQELKLASMAVTYTTASAFQLHHTGIKTACALEDQAAGGIYFNCTIQELKQMGKEEFRSYVNHFNCTIQELKLTYVSSISKVILNFNCTIQELKHASTALEWLRLSDFNCTIQELKQCLYHSQSIFLSISIAPYRN